MNDSQDARQLTTERGKTHGDWETQSQYCQSLKAVCHGSVNWPVMTDSQHDALEMIMVKVSRILAGDPNEKDHYRDIAGYAHLGGGLGKD